MTIATSVQSQYIFALGQLWQISAQPTENDDKSTN